jgi:hypothetical protein
LDDPRINLNVISNKKKKYCLYWEFISGLSSPLPVIVLIELSLHFVNAILHTELCDLPYFLVLTSKQGRSRDLFQAFANEGSDEDFI